MEAGALSRATSNHPPPLLERMVLCLIPPAARESVAGDLCELYQSPAHYVSQALRAIPFILLSQIRRNANVPVLALQGLLLFCCFGGFIAPDAWRFAGAATAVVLAGFVVIDAYRDNARPTARRAIVEAILAAGGAAELFGLAAAHILQPDWQAMPYFAFFGPYMIPVLCLVRTGIILWSDRGRPDARRDAEQLTRDYQAFARRTARRNRIEAGALVCGGLLLTLLPGQAPAIVAYLAAALYLLADGAARPLPQGARLCAVGAVFGRELARQHRIRSLVWWLWFVPLFLEIYRGLAGSAANPLSLLAGAAAALLCGFFIESLNRERRARIHEEIGTLSGVLESAVS